MFRACEILKADEFEDSYERIESLADKFEASFHARFWEALVLVKSQPALDLIEGLLREGRVEQATTIAETAAQGLADALINEWNRRFVQAGTLTSDFLEESLQVVVDFDQVNQNAVNAMQANRLDLVREVTQEQRATTQQVILDGVRNGANPREVARTVRDTIGLTQKQAQYIANYRRQLEQGRVGALQRALRDRRFDPTVRRAVSGEATLTNAQIDAMVSRYTQRWVDYRARVIARTEANRAAWEGNNAAYEQAFDDELVQELERKWNPARDARVRPSHSAMRGQVRPGLKEPFLSGDGNHLRYPGDRQAPAEDSIQCRCAVSTRFRRGPLAGAPGSTTG